MLHTGECDADRNSIHHRRVKVMDGINRKGPQGFQGSYDRRDSNVSHKLFPLCISLWVCACGYGRRTLVSDWPWGHTGSEFTHHLPGISIHIFFHMATLAFPELWCTYTEAAAQTLTAFDVFTHALAAVLASHKRFSYFEVNICLSWRRTRRLHNV